MTGAEAAEPGGEGVHLPAAIRVVLAEDQAMVRGAFASLLELEPDLEVVAAVADGKAAIAAVHAHEPDVLLTDIEMPTATGLDAAVQLRDHPTKVVIVTTFARAGYLQRALAAGVAGYVLKDAPIENMVAALRAVHAGGRAIDPQLAAEAWQGSADPLTDRERDVLRAAEGGAPVARIAQTLHLAEGTVRNYLSSAIMKTHATNRAEAAAQARDNGWL